MQTLAIETPQMVPHSINAAFGPSDADILRLSLKRSAMNAIQKDIKSKLITPDALFEQQIVPVFCRDELGNFAAAISFPKRLHASAKESSSSGNILIKYHNDDVAGFNKAVQLYRAYLDKYPFDPPYHYDQSEAEP